MKAKTKALITAAVMILLVSISYGYVEFEAAPVHPVFVNVTVDFNHQNYSGHSRVLLWINASWNGKVEFKTYCGQCGGVGMSFMGNSYNGATNNLSYDKSHNIGLSSTFYFQMYLSNAHNRAFNSTSISNLKPICCNKTIPTGYYAVSIIHGSFRNSTHSGGCYRSASFAGFKPIPNYSLIYIQEGKVNE